jgi:hypothetical protein
MACGRSPKNLSRAAGSKASKEVGGPTLHRRDEALLTHDHVHEVDELDLSDEVQRAIGFAP